MLRSVPRAVPPALTGEEIEGAIGERLLLALEALGSLPPQTPATAIAQIARGLIGSSRAVFFTAHDGSIADAGVDDQGGRVIRPLPSAPDFAPFYYAEDERDGLAPLYDLEPAPWVTLRLEAGTIRGAIVADGLTAIPTHEDLRYWRAFATALAKHLAIAHELLTVQDAASKDKLTGVYLRGPAFDVMDQRLQDGQPTTLIVVDLDGFKEINDSQGHAAGDAILQRAAQVLVNTCRPSHDIVARFGGDEFIIVTPATPAQLLPRIREALHAASIQASLGAAQSTENGDSREDLFAAADAAMYEDKKHRKASR